MIARGSYIKTAVTVYHDVFIKGTDDKPDEETAAYEFFAMDRTAQASGEI